MLGKSLLDGFENIDRACAGYRDAIAHLIELGNRDFSHELRELENHEGCVGPVREQLTRDSELVGQCRQECEMLSSILSSLRADIDSTMQSIRTAQSEAETQLQTANHKLGRALQDLGAAQIKLSKAHQDVQNADFALQEARAAYDACLASASAAAEWSPHRLSIAAIAP